MPPKRRLNARVLLVVAVLLSAALFALQGGEYGTTDLFAQRSRRAALAATVDSLRRQVDSLRRYKEAIATDPAVQERIAREQFGMIRPGELLYRFDRAPETERAGAGEVPENESGDAP